jgi:uncharacterized protein YtpQ (UPF0354 family)
MMTKKNHTAEDNFFTMLDCAKAYVDFKNADEDEREDVTEEQMDKIVAYALYLSKLNNQTFDEMGEGL